MSAAIPTFSQVARRPQWIAALLGCIAVAVVFALLGQWQIERAVEQGQRDERDTETAVALDAVAVPGEPMTTEAGGRIVTTSGSLVPSDFGTLAGRNQDDRVGWWVTGRALVPQGSGDAASLAVALAWFESEAAAREAATALADEAPSLGELELGGRYMPTEAPTDGDVRGGTREAMSLAVLVNEWQDWQGPLYAGYVIFDPAVAGAMPMHGGEPIVHARPVTDTQLNWLNVFYAIEWAAFMLFAFYLWYRLVKDALERELEAREDAAESVDRGADGVGPRG